MTGTSTGRGWLTRSDALPLGLLFAFALLLEGTVAVVASRSNDLPLPALAVFFDGHFYLEIAKSFPLPFSNAGLDYLGQAPGYPALAWLLRLLTPDAAVSWGTALLLASWVPAALCPVAFALVARESEPLGLPGDTRSWLWAGLLFAVLNPRWVSLAASAHPEPLAMLLLILALLAHQRGKTPVMGVLLCLCVLTRYPSLLLGLPFAWAVLVTRRQLEPASLAWVLSPLVAFSLIQLYLEARVPGFTGLDQTHSLFWETGLVPPFSELIGNASRDSWPTEYRLFEVTYGTVFFYLVAVVVGVRRSERALWMLPVWVGVMVGFHASLSGKLGAWDFARLVVLAWPAALLILWRLIRHRVPRAVLAAVSAAALAFSFSFAVDQLEKGIQLQRNMPSFAFHEDSIRRLDDDAPRWIDFRKLYEEREPTLGPVE